MRAASDFTDVPMSSVPDPSVAEDACRCAVTASPFATLVLDADGKVVLVNPAAETLFGRPSQDLLGNPLQPFLRDTLDEHRIRIKKPAGDEVAVWSECTEMTGPCGEFVVVSFLDLAPQVGARLDADFMAAVASAVVHELAQPNAAILSNAETARILLSRPNPNLDELRAIIEDIIADEHRVAHAIHSWGAVVGDAGSDIPESDRELVEKLFKRQSA